MPNTTFKVSEIIGDRYIILSHLGGGILSEVYKVKDIKTDEVFVLKCGAQTLRENPELGIAIKKEFFFLSQLRHPNIISTYEFSTLRNGTSFFIEEFFDGVPLTQFFSKGYAPELISVLAQILHSLAYIHSQGFVHSDLKPSHILVAFSKGKPVVKIIDFGFAEKHRLTKQGLVAFDTSDTGQARGTLGYCAPEILKGLLPDCRADLYSLGIILLEVLTKKGPSAFENILDFLKIQFAGGLDIKEMVKEGIYQFKLPEPPEKLITICQMMIASSPELRPSSSLEVMEALREVVKSGLSLPGPTGEVSRFATAPPEKGSPSGSSETFLTAPFVGRDSILKELKKGWERVKKGKGSIYLITGERGVGKSRLAQEFRFFCELDGARSFTFSSGSLLTRQKSILEMIMPALNLPKDLFNSPLKKRADNSILPLDLTREDFLLHKFQVFERICGAIKSLGRENPIFLFIDDLELFDDLSLEFIRYLGLSLKADKVFLLLSSLPEKRVQETLEVFDKKPNYSHIALSSFTLEETAELVEGTLGRISEPNPVIERERKVLTDFLFKTSGGNPLFIIDIIQNLQSLGAISIKRGQRRVIEDVLKEITLPSSLTASFKRKISLLTEEERRVLHFISLLGQKANLQLLKKVLEIEEDSLLRILFKLETLGYIREEASNLGPLQGNLTLTSHILESVLLEAEEFPERREDHKKIAEVLESLPDTEKETIIFDLAYHWIKAEVAEKAYATSLRAAEKARQLFLAKEALNYYKTALSFFPKEKEIRERLDLFAKIGFFQETLGDFNRAKDSYTQALSIIASSRELAKENKFYSEFLTRLGGLQQKMGNFEEAVRFYKEALAMEKGRQEERIVRILMEKGWAEISGYNFPEASESLGRALAIASRLPNRAELECRLNYYLAYLAYRRQDFSSALNLGEKALKLSREMGNEYQVNSILQFLATVFYLRGEKEKAEELYKKSEELGRKVSDVYTLISSLIGLGLSAKEAGDYRVAREYYEQAREQAEKISSLPHLTGILGNLAELFTITGEFITAEELYLKVMELSEKLKDYYILSLNNLNLSQLYLKSGKPEKALECLDKGEKIINSHKLDSLRLYLTLFRANYHLETKNQEGAAENFLDALKFPGIRDNRYFLEFLARLRLEERRPEKALISIIRLLRLFRNPKLEEHIIGTRLLGLALALLGKREESKEQIRKAIGLSRNSGLLFELGSALLSYGEILLFEKDLGLTRKGYQEALSFLKEAKEIFSSIGARSYQEKSEQLLSDLTGTSKTAELKAGERDILRCFYQLSETLNTQLTSEDFFERVLDIVIDITDAERGLLFLYQGEELIPVSARNIDHITLEDATTCSHTALKKVSEENSVILSLDALSDPNFENARSVHLNKIRSLLCCPLRTKEKIIGALYLDSRITSHLFLEEDKELLVSVANLLAATLDKSSIFKRIQEEFALVREDILIDATTGFFLGRSKAMRDVYNIVEKIAPSDCTVLIMGETGTGKGVLAKYIHSLSPRVKAKFVSINCGTLPETLFESELFGHVKGAFTGAHRDKEGLFETAEGGTIFLDEITNTTLPIQAKLLEVLEEKIIRRVGDTEPRKVDVRLICATNKNLEEEVKKGNFREDLYYRLNIVTITMPPLRERSSDIPQLAEYFLKRYAAKLNKGIMKLGEEAIAAMERYHWPGNIRELQNVIERAVIMAQKGVVTVENLGPRFVALYKEMGLAKARKEIGQKEIEEALDKTVGNVSHAAEILGIHRRQLQRLMKRYNINRQQYKLKIA